MARHAIYYDDESSKLVWDFDPTTKRQTPIHEICQQVEPIRDLHTITGFPEPCAVVEITGDYGKAMPDINAVLAGVAPCVKVLWMNAAPS